MAKKELEGAFGAVRAETLKYLQRDANLGRKIAYGAVATTGLLDAALVTGVSKDPLIQVAIFGGIGLGALIGGTTAYAAAEVRRWIQRLNQGTISLQKFLHRIPVNDRLPIFVRSLNATVQEQSPNLLTVCIEDSNDLARVKEAIGNRQPRISRIPAMDVRNMDILDMDVPKHLRVGGAVIVDTSIHLVERKEDGHSRFAHVNDLQNRLIRTGQPLGPDARVQYTDILWTDGTLLGQHGVCRTGHVTSVQHPNILILADRVGSVPNTVEAVSRFAPSDLPVSSVRIGLSPLKLYELSGVDFQ